MAQALNAPAMTIAANIRDRIGFMAKLFPHESGRNPAQAPDRRPVYAKGSEFHLCADVQESADNIIFAGYILRASIIGT